MAMALSSRRFYVLCNKSILFKFTQRRRIMASPFRKEKAIEELKNNPYYEKYAQKIATFQNTSPEEFLSRLKEINELKTKPKANTPEERKFSSLSDPKVDITKDSSPTYTKQKVLNDVMKMELIADKDGEEIKQFLFPLPRDKGYEFILCQFSGHESHFTPLINYQTHKENSPECLTMTHYTDIKEKGLVLMRGEYNKDILNGSEAQCLANQLQLYYGQDNTKRLQLLERFTYRPQEFKHMDLIAELECLTL
ncbi:ATP synthase mitochondrial F1 complex assembly factor 1 isoform X2 [Periplaneta americana]|uniref:ATP synthase mitochondrial F1 complex assembly factor 1 isoform X2 n=1 Tax=Periplaneta americana TaxID=6978 RepID=UPI0037E79872